MATVKELLRAENDGTLSFGDYTLPTKTKQTEASASEIMSSRQKQKNLTLNTEEIFIK